MSDRDYLLAMRSVLQERVSLPISAGDLDIVVNLLAETERRLEELK